jgi:hypothetical protein
VKRTLVLNIILLLAACGTKSEHPADTPAATPTPAPSTPFGSVADIRAYLTEIDPYIRQVSQLQAQVEQQIGSSGKVTSQNLAAAAAAAAPPLRAAIDRFQQLRPPALLAPVHEEISQLMVSRLDAYTQAVEGWKREQQNGDTTWQRGVEAQLQRANELIARINPELQQLNQLVTGTGPTQVAKP